MLISKILQDKSIDGVATVQPGSSVGDAVKILSNKKIGAVIVSKDGVHVAGILSERDVVGALGSQGTRCLGDPVDSIMTAKLISCKRGDRAIQVLQTMTEKRFRHMPVMEGDEMVGLVSIGDVVKARLDELSQQADALKSMIMGY